MQRSKGSCAEALSGNMLADKLLAFLTCTNSKDTVAHTKLRLLPSICQVGCKPVLARLCKLGISHATDSSPRVSKLAQV